MTFFPLKDSDHFVTKIEAYPEWSLSGSQNVATTVASNDPIVMTSASMVLRDYLNSSNHYFYRIADDIRESVLSCSIIFYQHQNGSAMDLTVRNLARFYENYPLAGYKYTSDYSGTYGHVIISIPKYYFGKKIMPGTFKIIEMVAATPTSYNVRELYDNGSGTLHYRLVNPVVGSQIDYGTAGYIFYSEGVCVLTGAIAASVNPVRYHYPVYTNFTVHFTGSYNIYTLNTFCHVGKMEANFSNNSSSYVTSSDYGTNIKALTGSEDKVWITGIGLYDKEYRLIGSAKFSSPIRKRIDDKLLIKIKTDY